MRIILPINQIITGAKWHHLNDMKNFTTYKEIEIVPFLSKTIEIDESEVQFYFTLRGEVFWDKMIELANDIKASQAMFFTPNITDFKVWLKADLAFLDEIVPNELGGNGILTIRDWSLSDYPNVPFASNGSECIVRIPQAQVNLDEFLTLVDLKEASLNNVQLLTIPEMQGYTSAWV